MRPFFGVMHVILSYHKHEFGENMQMDYQNTRNPLYKIAGLAVLMIRNTYYMYSILIL
jgi:hypothetical protein